MGLLLSVLITCVGVLEVIACYTHFRIGTAYNECKSNIRDIAKYYAVELRKHELHFEPGPDDGGPSTSQETLSELMAKRTVRTQEKPQHNQTMTDQDIVKLHSNGHIVNAATSCSDTPEQGTPNLAANLKVPRNSVCGLDSPTVQKLISSEVDITDAIVEKIQSLESNKWIRKSPSPYPDKTGLEVVEKDFWRSRSPSPFPESKDSDSGVEMIYTPGLRKTRDVSPVLETPDIPEIVDIDLDDSSVYSKTDLEVQNITESIMRSEIPRQASPYPETLFGITADTAETEETKFDEAFLRSLDGVNKSSKCDDRRRSFKKKRNSSSTSSRASRDEISRSMTSLDEIDLIDKKPEGELKKISPLTEEETEIISQEVNGHEIRTETVIPEKCESIVSPTPEQFIDKNKGAATVTKQEETLFEAKVSPNTSQESSKPDKGKANLAFTEKVKDLEISVQLLVTVKGTSQGDKMEYTTTVTQDDQKPNPQKALDVKEETVTKTTEEKSEFGNVKTSVTYGSSIQEPEEVKVEEKPNLKDLQISSQSLIHAERTVQDDVASSEAEFLKLYETFTELPDKEKDKFLQKIGQSSKSFEDHVENSNTEINLENPPAENIKMVPKIEPVIEKQNQPKSSTEEKILITEITEITESTESVITIPPEIPTDKKEVTKNIIETADAKLTEISTSDKNVDNSAEVVSSTKECDQNVIENENKHVAIIESNVTQKQVNNSENIPNEKQIVPEPSKIENLETVNVSQQINTQNIEQTNDVNIDKPEKQIITESNIITTETQTKSEPKIINTTTIKQKTIIPENENVFVENESVNIDTRTKDNQVSEITIEETKTSVNTETDIPLNQITEKQIIEKSSKSEEKTEQNACNLKDKTITTIESEEINKESSKSKEETKQVTNNLEEKIITTMETEVPVKQIIKVQSKSEEEPKQAIKNVEEETITTVTEKDVETISNNENTSTKPSQTNDESKKSTEIEKSSPEAPKAESSSDSSSTPSTVLENPLRRASKTAFEDATPVQNQEMMKRRVSTSEISPKQASQAFWLIFSAEYTNAMEKDWHGQHFSCWQCDESLTGQRYVLRDDHPYCVKCYEQVFANPCEKCSRIIGIDSKDLSYKDKHWHEACFQCTTCNESLVDKQFGAKGEKIYCGNCYDKQFASRCDGCSKIFHAGTKKMEYKNRQWHEQCFKCCKCETPIGTKSFIPREKDIYCAGCYEEKFATRCVKCDKAIQSGGVTYKNEPWHRECFTCTHCNKNLAGQRFTSRDDKPCCAECFGRLFAKRCTSCAEPITGIGGTRFISFEDRHWHNDCFICATCSTSLVGRGFITDEDKIICPECAKERFM